MIMEIDIFIAVSFNLVNHNIANGFYHFSLDTLYAYNTEHNVLPTMRKLCVLLTITSY